MVRQGSLQLKKKGKVHVTRKCLVLTLLAAIFAAQLLAQGDRGGNGQGNGLQRGRRARRAGNGHSKRDKRVIQIGDQQSGRFHSALPAGGRLAGIGGERRRQDGFN